VWSKVYGQISTVLTIKHGGGAGVGFMVMISTRTIRPTCKIKHDSAYWQIQELKKVKSVGCRV